MQILLSRLGVGTPSHAASVPFPITGQSCRAAPTAAAAAVTHEASTAASQANRACQWCYCDDEDVNNIAITIEVTAYRSSQLSLEIQTAGGSTGGKPMLDSPGTHGPANLRAQTSMLESDGPMQLQHGTPA